MENRISLPGDKHLKMVRHHVCGLDERLFYAGFHDDFEILHVIDGTGHFVYDNKFYELKPNRIFLINASRFHYSNPDNPEEYVRNGAEFSPSDFISLFHIFEQPDFLTPFLTPNSHFSCIDLSDNDSRTVDTLFRELLCEVSGRPAGYMMNSFGIIIKILSIAVRSAGQNNGPGLSPGAPKYHVVSIITYISEHLGDFNLQKMAAELSLNKYYLCHLFKESTGLTIHNYLFVKRLEAARFRLSSTTDPISDIAMDLGFSSFSLFSRSFKSATGITPREYRKSCYTSDRPQYMNPPDAPIKTYSYTH